MHPPDLAVAALLILAQLHVDIVLTSRWRPDLDHEWEGVTIQLEGALAALGPNKLHRNHVHVRDVIARRGALDLPHVSPEVEQVPVDLLRELHEQPGGHTVMVDGRRWFPSQFTAIELPVPFWVLKGKLTIGFRTDRHILTAPKLSRDTPVQPPWCCPGRLLTARCAW